ncbi:hypothetical protein B9Z55_021247 [Caenorhabditis nigoni]|uniref:SPK domain-containing protein n=1 Tax=Caenorhabditis nigoni TaxID=1611254 RepID=A0A2G5TR21_9PELO|nr:hypothetical protein B9Z55_021247 [Caenorhabditis nigoni]
MSTACLDLSFVIRYISDRIGNYDKPECLFQWCKKVLREYRPHKMFYANLMSIRVSQKLNSVETLEGFSLMEKLQLVFIFSRPVSDEFVQILTEAKFVIYLDENNRISRFSTADGSVVRSSDHHPDVKYFQGVDQQGNKAPKILQIKEEPVEKNEPKFEEIKQEPKQEVDDFMDIGQNVQQPAFNGRINYDELDEQEFVYLGFPQNIKLETFIGPQKRRQSSTTVNVKRVRIEQWEWETVASSSDSTSTSSNKKVVKIKKSKKIATPSSNTSDQSTNAESPSSTIPKKLVVTSWTLSNAPSDSFATSPKQNLVKVGKSNTSGESASHTSSSTFTPDSSSLVETTSNASAQPPAPEVKSTAMVPDEPKISVLAMATLIETIAEYYELRGLQEKASLAMMKMKDSGEEKTLSVKKFNSLIGSLLICMEENIIRQTTKSIPLKSLLKILQLYLIRPLGSEAAFELISQKILEFKNNNDGIPPNLLSDCLNNLLIATGFYNQRN